VKVERVPWAAGRHQLTWSYVADRKESRISGQ